MLLKSIRDCLRICEWFLSQQGDFLFGRVLVGREKDVELGSILVFDSRDIVVVKHSIHYSQKVILKECL